MAAYEQSLAAAVSTACLHQSAHACSVHRVQTKCRGATAVTFFDLYGAPGGTNLSNVTAVVPLKQRYNWLEDLSAVPQETFPGNVHLHFDMEYESIAAGTADGAAWSSVVASVRAYTQGLLDDMSATAASSQPVQLRLTADSGHITFGSASHRRHTRSGTVNTTSVATVHYSVRVATLAEYWALHDATLELQQLAKSGKLVVPVKKSAVNVIRVRGGTGSVAANATVAGTPGQAMTTTILPIDGSNKGGASTSTDAIIVVVVSVLGAITFLLCIVVAVMQLGCISGRQKGLPPHEGVRALPLGADEYLDIGQDKNVGARVSPGFGGSDGTLGSQHYYPSTRVAFGGRSPAAMQTLSAQSNDDWSVWGFDETTRRIAKTAGRTAPSRAAPVVNHAYGGPHTPPVLATGPFAGLRPLLVQRVCSLCTQEFPSAASNGSVMARCDACMRALSLGANQDGAHAGVFSAEDMKRMHSSFTSQQQGTAQTGVSNPAPLTTKGGLAYPPSSTDSTRPPSPQSNPAPLTTKGGLAYPPSSTDSTRPPSPTLPVGENEWMQTTAALGAF